MVVQPRKQNPQHQPLTVSLRKICRDYPAGSGVLKELLQNADDAGASTVKFVLDTSSHSDLPVLVDGLSEYQGPALLAYNDALFSEKDFQSLTSLGDSKKLQDKAATGKFGLGFSSVFNWTDCPSVLSGSTLLFLDPHHSWSRGFDPPGGPEYDFPVSATDEAMMNQLRYFSLINTEWQHPFQGTIIRIPLRNALQAKRSEISTKETTTDDIAHSLNSFAEEMGSDGLLFLNSVQRIVLSVDDKQLNEIEVTNGDSLTSPKEHLRSIVASSMNQDQIRRESYYEVHIRHRFAGQEIIKEFGVLNLLAGSIRDPSLENWASSEKLFPWVAVAAPLKNLKSGNEVGRLFSTLPLPIPTGLPVHIHGRFSISDDRSRIHGAGDRGVQDHRPQEWNKFLFNQVIPTAWANLLLEISRAYPNENHFHIWPTNRLDSQQLWSNLCPAIVEQISQNRLPVWFTDFGHITLEDGLLASDKTTLKDKTAFREARIPVIFAPKYLFDQARQRAGNRNLEPRTLYEYLHRMESLDHLSKQSKLTILEILLREIPLTDLGALEIFPFCDGNFRSLRLPRVFLHRTSSEKALFIRQVEVSIDTDQLSDCASNLLRKAVEQGGRVVRYRTSEDLRDYFLKHIARGSGDIIEHTIPMLDQVWDWILRYGGNPLPLSTLGPLWLIPLRGSSIRKLVPLDSSNFVTWFDPGEMNDLSVKISTTDPRRNLRILAGDVLSDKAMQYLHTSAVHEPSLLLKDGKKFRNFAEFLARERGLLQIAADDIKASVLRKLTQLYQSQSQPNPDFLCKILKSLCIFKAVQWPANATSVKRYWTDMTRDATFIGLRKLVPVPFSSKRVFLDVSDENERRLLEGMGLVECLNDVWILERIVIPALQNGGYKKMNSSFRLDVADLLFQNYYHISRSTRSFLPSLAVVPLQKGEDENGLLFGRPSDILDPRKLTIRSLYFDNEIRLPEPRFYDLFSAALAECGMVQSLNKRVVLDRVQSYGRKGLAFDAVASRARSLLQTPFPRDVLQTGDLTHVLREHEWLPARTPNMSDRLSNASTCRESSDEPVVGRVWHVLPFQIDKSWRSILGWDEPISVDVLMSQLDRSIAAEDIHSVDRTLSYIQQHHAAESYVERLLKLNFVRSSNGKLANAATFCHRGAERLTPYLYNVEPRFWSDHAKIMSLAKIPERPKLEQLKDVLRTLDSQGTLDEQELEVAVELAHIWSDRFLDAVDELRLPNDNAVLVPLGDLVFNDTPWLSAGTRAILHRTVSRTIAERLRIEPLSELAKKRVLGIEDPDDDEFDQREEVADGIRDTLDRYTREYTFHEYLANADDCGSASEVNFFFDGTTYGTKHLIDEDLKDLQGPSLLIHNDGVFKESDFEGLKYVGRGSKREDPTTIGKFGRGSQTMYHWTDVPMILSGEHLLILDPLRKHLPLNHRTRQRKPGIIVKYAKLKPTCQDQLAPFEGRWGFDSNQGFYNGTIFRFPLRIIGQGSELLESGICPDEWTTIGLFNELFNEARLALLFLRKIATIDFSVKGDIGVRWRVRRGKWPEEGTFSDWANVVAEQRSGPGKVNITTERWWRAIEDVRNAPVELQHRHRRRMKYVECGIAASVPQSQKGAGPSLKPLKPRFFNCLPLKFESTLPVQVHASFLLSGDRQNIAAEETSQDAGSEWNKWLLQKELPRIYLKFLEDIGRKVGQDVYNYFPVESSRGRELLSDLIRTSFWENIRSSRCQLFPVVEASQDLDDPRVRGRKNRTAPNLITFERAVFDVLDQRGSKAFQPLLDGCLDDLVRPPVQLAKHIRRVPEVKVLTPAIVRGVLRSPRATKYVEKAKRSHEGFLDALLSFIMPTTTDEVVELDGCPVLPLANGKLGTLLLKSKVAKGGGDGMYFSADTKVHDLFAFASPLLAANKGNEKFVEKILSSNLLNLKTLEKSDVGVMLGCKESWTPKSTPKTWLHRFWKYMNSPNQPTPGSTAQEAEDLGSLQHFPLLLLLHRDGKETFDSLHNFHKNPVVVQSTVKEHMNLFRRFPGLAVVDAETIPKPYCEAENSLLYRASISRFLKSLNLLAVTDGTTVTEFVRGNLDKENIKVLRNIIEATIPGAEFGLPPLDIADDLPIWQRISSKRGYLTAKEAIVAEDAAFVVPWIKNYHQFAKSCDLRPQLRIDGVGMLRKHVLPDLPEFIDGENRDPYIGLVKAISQKISDKEVRGATFSTSRLAARQDGKLCLASDLFNGNDAVFRSAFRLEACGRFLMPEVRTYRALWNELGIRHRESERLKGPDYLACLRALEGRLTGGEDSQLAIDTEIVLHPLCRDGRALATLDNSSWSDIAKLAIFPVRPVSAGELEYRRHHMEVLASQKSTLCLEHIVRQEFIACCWSQTPFVLHEPLSISFRKCGSEGQPTWAMVWNHLAFLADAAQSIQMAQVPDFIGDLETTYRHLQLHLEESKNHFTIPDAAIWLNVETTNPKEISLDVLRSSWTKLDHLLLDSPCNAPPLMTVQPFLGRYSPLLKVLGCESLHFPQIDTAFLGKSEMAFNCVRELWKRDFLTDVKFEAEGKSMSAHKVILASRSSYCEAQFNGAWALTSGNNGVVRLEDMTYATLEILIEFCYHDYHDWAGGMRVTPDDDVGTIAEKLDGLLDVLVAADRWLMPSLHADAQNQVIMGIKFFVRPDNVGDVEKVAGEANATKLKDYCEQYGVENAAAVMLANAGTD